jgi:hypothetical protein
VALTASFCVLSVVLLLRASMTPAPVPFAVAIMVVAFASLLYAVGSGVAQHLGRWPESEGARVDVKVLVAAVVAVLVLSGLGALVGLWRVAGAIAAEPALEMQEVLRWVREASGLCALGLLVALSDGLALLILRRHESERVDEVRRWSGSLTVEPHAAGRILTRTG